MLAPDKLLACSVFFVSGLALKPLVRDLVRLQTLFQQLASACGIDLSAGAHAVYLQNSSFQLQIEYY